MDRSTLHPPLNFEELAHTGFWFCRGCQHVVTEIDPDQLVPKCLHCGSDRLKFCEPVPEPH